MSFNPTFTYRSLPSATSIRVLRLNPGTVDERIDCHFLPCDLDADPAEFPDQPKSVEATGVKWNEDTGQVYYMPYDILDDGLPSPNLHPFQTYQALSYVWGSTAELETLCLEGEDFLVTRNLLAALQAMRHPQFGIKIWVDAICIDQASLSEKKTQIPLMGRIYRQADSVWAQVLPTFEKADQLRDLAVAILTAARALEADVRSRQRDRNNANTVDEDEKSPTAHAEPKDEPSLLFSECALEDYNLPPETSPLWQAWRELFSSPFFQRIWVQQEVLLAKDLKWNLGTTIVDPRAIATCIEFMNRYSRNINSAYLSPEGLAPPITSVVLSPSTDPVALPKPCFDPKAGRDISSGYIAAEKMLAERRRMRNSSQRSLLIDLLSTYRTFSATEARDMVFGLLGLASDADEFYRLVDYTSPLESVFIRLAQRFIELGHGAKLLSQASNTMHSGALPSWVPNWAPATESSTTIPHQYVPIQGQDFTAGGEDTSGTTIEVVGDPHNLERPVLRVCGSIVDTIQRCTPAAQVGEILTWLQQTYDITVPAEFFPEGSVDLLMLWVRTGLEFARENAPRGTGGGLMDFLETCCQARRGFWTDNSYHSTRLGFVHFISHNFEITMPDELIDRLRGGFHAKDETLSLKDFVNDAITPIGHHRRFCTTERGLFGLVSSTCAPGDKVFVLRGGAVPFVLRPAAEGLTGDQTDQRYRLIGDAYVKGVMYGEGLAFDGVQESSILLV